MEACRYNGKTSRHHGEQPIIGIRMVEAERLGLVKITGSQANLKKVYQFFLCQQPCKGLLPHMTEPAVAILLYFQ
jgi:hypothetical protein